jgi:hypothetical protein
VNNAGCNIRKPATDVTWDDWNEIVNTNLRGAFFVAQAAACQMIPRRYGRIVNIGSVTCVAGYAGLAPYGASRGGIKQMTMSLAHDWGQHGITVNCLAPGWFKTAQNRALYDDPGWVEYLCERIPLGRPGEMGDLDGALIAAERAKTSRDSLTRSEGYAVLAWVHLMRAERDEAEAAASVARRLRTRDPLLVVALVVAAGGPSAGAAVALIETQGVTSLVAATRVFADQDKLADVRAEIARLSPKEEEAALENLQVGLVALGRGPDIDEVAAGLAGLGWTPDRDVAYASVLGGLGLTELALRYLQLAADRGLTDLDPVVADPSLVDALAQPAFAAVRDRIAANASTAADETGS